MLVVINPKPLLSITNLLRWMPESPKWLLTAGKLEKAEEIMQSAARENGRQLSDTWKLSQVHKPDIKVKNGNLLDLMRSKQLLQRTLVLYINWFANSFVYYGLTLNSGNIGGSYRLNFLINGCLEIPAYALSMWVIQKGGRKWPYVSLMIAGGVILASTTMVPKGQYWMNWPILALAMAGKFCLTGTRMEGL